jgi:hypothetical protein
MLFIHKANVHQQVVQCQICSRMCANHLTAFISMKSPDKWLSKKWAEAKGASKSLPQTTRAATAEFQQFCFPAASKKRPESQDVARDGDRMCCLPQIYSDVWRGVPERVMKIHHLSLFVDVLPKKPSWIGVPWPLSWAEAKWWRIGTEMLEAKGGSVPCALSKPPKKIDLSLGHWKTSYADAGCNFLKMCSE